MFFYSGAIRCLVALTDKCCKCSKQLNPACFFSKQLLIECENSQQQYLLQKVRPKATKAQNKCFFNFYIEQNELDLYHLKSMLCSNQKFYIWSLQFRVVVIIDDRHSTKHFLFLIILKAFVLKI